MWSVTKLYFIKFEFDKLDVDRSGFISKKELKEKKDGVDQILSNLGVFM